jgi:tRNA(fMet)-specific endonuclease VapC
MTYLLDSDWAISFLNGRQQAVDLVTRLADDGIALSIISWGEIYEGLLAASSSMERRRQFEQFAETLDVISPDVGIARTYAQLRSDLRSQGNLLADNDLWIAATALSRAITLATRDRHFTRIPGLSLFPIPE